MRSLGEERFDWPAYVRLERAKGFEPSTPTLARSCSTPELHPHPRTGEWVAAGRARYAKWRPGLQHWHGNDNRSVTAGNSTAKMSATPDDLFAFLDRLGIRHTTVRHPPLFTVEQSQALRGTIPGGHTKNLFLKDKKDTVFLVVASEDARVDLKTLHHRLGASRFSFGSAA